LGAKTAYLLFDETTDYTVLLARYFKERYLQVGGQIVGEDTYAGGATDFSAQIAKLKGLGIPPDMLYVSSGPDEIGPLVKQLRDAGVDEAVFGGDTPLLLEIAGEAGERRLLHDPRPLRPDAGGAAREAGDNRPCQRRCPDACGDPAPQEVPAR
jgi:ABC-type branched-subunit amino acid transport system substrate-binding protein